MPRLLCSRLAVLLVILTVNVANGRSDVALGNRCVKGPSLERLHSAEKRQPTSLASIQFDASVQPTHGSLSCRGGQEEAILQPAIVTGILLALNSGFINGCCLSGAVAWDGSRQAVAAVTGAYTTSALGLASGNLRQFATQLSVLLCYVTGSAISGLMNPNPVAFAAPSSTDSLCLFTGAVLLFYAAVLASHADSPPLACFCLAAMASGVQNSLSSAATGNLCRTTHFTGISSDIGTFLGQILRGNRANLFRLRVFGALTLAFWTGGLLSLAAAERFAAGSLVFGALLYAALGAGLVEAMFQRRAARVVPERHVRHALVGLWTGR